MKWRAECQTCPFTVDLDWGHKVPTSFFEHASREAVLRWKENHHLFHQDKDGSIADIKVVQTTTIVVNVESLNKEILDRLFARSH